MQNDASSQFGFGSLGVETPFANNYVDYTQGPIQPMSITPIGNNMNFTNPAVTFGAPASMQGNWGGSDLLTGRLAGAANISENGYQGMDLAKQGLGSLKQGWGDLSMNQKFNTGIGAAQSLFGMYAGFKQLGMAKKQMQQQANQWNQTWGAAKKGLNEASELRAKLRNNGVQSGIDRDNKKYQV